MKFWFQIATLFLVLNTFGQSLPIRPERESILLGERNVLHISLEKPILKQNLVEFSSISGVIMSDKKDKDTALVEVLGIELDASELRLIVTAWDSGVVLLPSFAIDKSGTWVTQATSFRVEFPKVEENGEILDIKETTFDIPLFQNFNERYWWILDLLLLLLFMLGLILLRRVKDSKQVVVVQPEIVIPAEETALKAIEELYNKKQFDSVAQKNHFATFSDILRAYISARYDIVTFEKTTSELGNSLRLKNAPLIHRNMVDELLSISDMVKFSKATTDETEIERLRQLAEQFVLASTSWNKSDKYTEKGESKDV